jgi:hypothetical protein
LELLQAEQQQVRTLLDGEELQSSKLRKAVSRKDKKLEKHRAVEASLRDEVASYKQVS